MMKRHTGKLALINLLNELKHCRQRVAELNRDIRQLATHELYRDNVKLLKSVPGIGTLTAMILLTELGDIFARFNNLDKIAAFIGLIPGECSSGEEDQVNNTRITPRSHHYLRSMLVECA